MGIRKVLNNYVHPEFDHALLPKFKKKGSKMYDIRMMLPFSFHCSTCGEFLYRATKINSRTEYVEGEDYLGIKKVRFYFKCPNCGGSITFKTDPKNQDYEVESGAERNYEAWKEQEKAENDQEQQRNEEEKMDSMKALENRTLDSRLEMDMLDSIEEIRALNKRNGHVDLDNIFKLVHGTGPTASEEDQIAAEAKEAFKQPTIRRIQDIHEPTVAVEEFNVAGMKHHADDDDKHSIRSSINITTSIQPIKKPKTREEPQESSLSSLISCYSEET